jgi:hypothetical protein
VEHPTSPLASSRTRETSCSYLCAECRSNKNGYYRDNVVFLPGQSKKMDGCKIPCPGDSQHDSSKTSFLQCHMAAKVSTFHLSYVPLAPYSMYLPLSRQKYSLNICIYCKVPERIVSIILLQTDKSRRLGISKTLPRPTGQQAFLSPLLPRSPYWKAS